MGERPAGLSIKPPKPPFYEGTRHGTFSQWVFHVRQYLQMMCITDEAYGVQFATTYLRGSAALWWQNIVETRGFDAITTWEGFMAEASLQFGAKNDRIRARDELA